MLPKRIPSVGWSKTARPSLTRWKRSGTEVSEADKLVDWSLGVSAGAKTGLRFTMAVVPIAGLLIAFLWFRKRYKLTDEKVAQIAAQVRARREGKA